MRLVDIQFQDTNGDWKTVQTIPANDTFIRRTLDAAARTYNNRRIRAIDHDSGTLIDMRG